MFRRAKPEQIMGMFSIIILPAMAFTEGEQSVVLLSFPYIVPL